MIKKTGTNRQGLTQNRALTIRHKVLLKVGL